MLAVSNRRPRWRSRSASLLVALRPLPLLEFSQSRAVIYLLHRPWFTAVDRLDRPWSLVSVHTYGQSVITVHRARINAKSLLLDYVSYEISTAGYLHSICVLKRTNICRRAFQQSKILRVTNLYVLESITYVPIKKMDIASCVLQLHQYNASRKLLLSYTQP